MIELTQANSVRIPLADESVHCVVTSPPYLGLRSYSLSPMLWGGREDCRHEWGDELAWTGKVAHGTGRSTLTGGHESWGNREGEAQGQFCRLCGCWRGSLGLEPDIGSYVQHLVEIFREVRRVLRKDGTVWLNLGDSYAGAGYSNHYNTGGAVGKDGSPGRKTGGLKPKDLCGIPWRVALALQADGWWLRSEITWCKKAPMPESVRDRPTSATEKIFLLSKSKTYFYDQEATKVPAVCVNRNDGTGHYRGNRQSLAESDLMRLTNRDNREAMNRVSTGRNMWNYLLLGPEPYSGKHFAVFPSSIPDIAIRAGTSQRGCCPECGKAWVRVIKKEGFSSRKWQKIRGVGTKGDDLRMGMQGKSIAGGRPPDPIVYTTGWRPACDCYGKPMICPGCHGTRFDWQAQMDALPMTDDEWAEWYKTAPRCTTCGGNGVVKYDILWPDDRDRWPTKPCTVLDPFCGSGTTLLAARRLGRSAIGLDLSYTYLRDQARSRLELDKMAEWESGREAVKTDWEGLPLFEQS